jgi:hypothetical protein
VSSLVALIISIQTIEESETLATIGRFVTSTVMLIFSLDLIRIAYSYHSFSEASGIIEKRAANLLRTKNVQPIPAMKLMHEYQMARAVAPMIPNWIWKLMRNDLNRLWRAYRQH